MDKMEQYKLFLDPFDKKDQFAFCQWNPEEKESLADAAPKLEEIVAHRAEWRAVILCTEDTVYQRNPFDYVRHVKPAQEEGESNRAYYDRCQEMLYNAYEIAAETPFVRLVTKLCTDPSVTYSRRVEEIRLKIDEETEAAERAGKIAEAIRNGEGNTDELIKALVQEIADRFPEEVSEELIAKIAGEIEADIFEKTAAASPEKLVKELTKEIEDELVEEGVVPVLSKDRYVTADDWAYLSYYEASERKSRIREKIRGTEKIRFALPSEIVCIARRIAGADLESSLETGWATHDELQYADFQDANLYFEKMRYLVFDLSDKEKKQYTYDYIRFTYALMILAGNQAPRDAMSPNRIYRLDCDLDKEFLKEFFGQYVAKLNESENTIETRIRTEKRTTEERLENDKAREIFCTGVHIKVVQPERYSERDLKFNDQIRIVEDEPTSENNRWTVRMREVRKNLHVLLKQPKRAVKNASEDVRRLDTLDEERAANMNEFQIEDVREFVSEEERAMVESPLISLYEEEYYVKQMETADKRAKSVMVKHMTRKRATVISLIMAGIALLSAIPFVINNLEWIAVPYLLFVISFVIIALFLVCLITMKSLRNKVRRAVAGFNDTMNKIRLTVDESMELYALYLSHVCNALRGNSVLDYNYLHGNEKNRRITILKKHIGDIEDRKGEVNAVFGMFTEDALTVYAGKEEPYEYDFYKAVDYPYELPIDDSRITKIPYMDPGYLIEIPVAFIREVTISREELYD